MEGHVEAPSTIKEVGIHVGYMRDDIRELKEIVKSLPSVSATVPVTFGTNDTIVVTGSYEAAS